MTHRRAVKVSHFVTFCNIVGSRVARAAGVAAVGCAVPIVRPSCGEAEVRACRMLKRLSRGIIAGSRVF